MLQPSDARAWASLTCGHCGASTASAVLAFSFDGNNQPVIRWVRCTGCGKGSVIDEGGVASPPPPAGEPVDGLPPEIAESYSEARRCLQVYAHTATELVCRKILMYVAHDKGAAPNLKFVQYLDYLKDSGYVTPPMEPWVQAIKDHGNEATHELPHVEQQRAESTLSFVTQLLRVMYETPHRFSQLSGNAPAPSEQAPDIESA